MKKTAEQIADAEFKREMLAIDRAHKALRERARKAYKKRLLAGGKPDA